MLFLSAETKLQIRVAVNAMQGYSALRGPFVSSVVEQLLTGTQWGALDYLVVDLPPGTGDIHITLTQQQVPMDGCVVVTTAQSLRYGSEGCVCARCNTAEVLRLHGDA